MAIKSSVHIDPKIVAAAVERHPRLQEFKGAVQRRFGVDEAAARTFAERLLTSQLKRVGHEYVDAMVGHIQRMFENRERIATIVDQVIAPDGLAPAEAGQQLGQLFKDLKQDVEAISSPGEFAKRKKIKPPEDIEFEFDITADERARQASPEANKIPVAQPTGRHVERVDVIKAKVAKLSTRKQSVLRKAAEFAPNELWRAVASETERGLDASVEALKARATANGLSPREIAALEQAARELSLERARSQRLPGGAAALRGAAGLESLSPALRKLVQGDFVLEPLAAENPALLEEYFSRSGAKSRTALRRYVRRQMVTHVRGLIGEFTAAFQLGERLVLLKGPDYHVTIPGTDLVGVTRDGRVWLIDNKAMSAAELDSVTSLTRNIPKNLADDAAAFAGIKGLGDDPAIVDAVNRLAAATAEVKKLTAGMSADEAGSLAVQKKIDAICRKNKIDRVVTNAGGQIQGLSAGLKGRGIRLADLNRALEPDVKPKP